MVIYGVPKKTHIVNIVSSQLIPIENKVTCAFMK